MNTELQAKIRKAYRNHRLEHGKKPASIYKFCKDLGIKEEEFYECYGSFDSLEKDFWVAYFEETMQKVEKDADVFTAYNTKEKLLAIYFTWLEVLKSNRSYILIDKQQYCDLRTAPSMFKSFKARFLEIADGLIQQGIEEQMVKDRVLLTSKYKDGLWLLTFNVLQFWLKDDSPSFSATDAYVEKSVNLFFEMVKENAFDMSFDLVKFMYQNR